MRTKSMVAGLVVALMVTPNVRSADELADGFQNPDRSARPWTWWHWVSGNVSKEGITADLEAMNRVGLGGFQAFSVEQGPKPEKPVLYLSAEWRELMKHAVAESYRLNLAMTMHACEGWSESGGPWIKPEQSMQKVVWTEAGVKGPGRVELVLPRPEATAGEFKDVAVLAFPKRAGDEVNMAALKPTVRVSGGTSDAGLAADGDANTRVVVKPDKGGAAFVECAFDHPVRIGSLGVSPVSVGVKGELQVSADGKAFKSVGPFSAGSRAKGRQVAVFEPTEVRAVRVYVPKVAEGKPWTVGEVEVSGARVPDYVARSGMEVKVVPATMPSEVASDLVIARDGVIDLTANVDGAGRLAWDAPAGEWTVLRLASTSTGMMTYPAMEETRGLECDKMDRKIVTTQFGKTVGQVLEDTGGAKPGGGGLKWVLLDSWEAGCQNWSAMFREEFIGKRKYDPLKWLPALTGRVVGSPAETERFLWDYRMTIAQLVAENHFGLFRDLCHQNGLKLMSEAVGIGMPTIADELQCKGRTDVPMGEFWVDRVARDGDPKEAASAAHIYGQNIAAAESYTAQAAVAGWKNDPASLKTLGDKMFCLGINQFVFHRYAHQPYMDKVPGVTMGPWGINFERTNTWWEQGRAWVEYITRCQELLRRGTFVADVCYYYGEGAPVCLDLEALKPAPPVGFDFDACNREVLLTRMGVEGGMVVLPGGMRYRVLVLPDTVEMTPEVARKVRELVKAGATVVGPKPVRSPSLVGYPACDEEVKRIGEELWDSGRVVSGKKLREVLGVKPDFETAEEDVRYIHRRDGGSEIYFVSNQKNVGRVVDCTFRVGGKEPELWWPMTGRVERAGMWWEKEGRTTVRIPLEESGSVFVVFRGKADGVGLADVRREGKSIFEVPDEGPAGKLEIRKAVYGAIETNGGQRDVTAKVAAAVEGGKLAIVPGNGKFGKDPAPLVHKQFRVDYVYNGVEGSVTVPEGKMLRIPEAGDRSMNAMAEVAGGELTAWKGGTYELVGADGGVRKVSVQDVPMVELGGRWEVRFEKGRRAPESVGFEKLVSWTDRPEEGVKYFSGTATYVKEFEVKEVGDRVRLDLGGVKNLAEVSVNGKELGVLWKPPFVVDVTGAVKKGMNHLEVRVTNLWPNRLIGDQFLPENERVTWTTYNPYKKDSPLLRSGLMGPVRLEFGRVMEVSR